MLQLVQTLLLLLRGTLLCLKQQSPRCTAEYLDLSRSSRLSRLPLSKESALPLCR